MLQQAWKIAQTAGFEIELVFTLVDPVIESSYSVVDRRFKILDGLMFIGNISGIFQPVGRCHRHARENYQYCKA